MFCIELFQNNLNTKIIGNQNFYHSTTDSTNSDIWELLKKEKKEGFVVIANEQHSGRGRNSKKWYSKKNTSRSKNADAPLKLAVKQSVNFSSSLNSS